MVMSVSSVRGPGLRGLRTMLPTSPRSLLSSLNATEGLWVCAFGWERETKHGIRLLLEWGSNRGAARGEGYSLKRGKGSVGGRLRVSLPRDGLLRGKSSDHHLLSQ